MSKKFIEKLLPIAFKDVRKEWYFTLLEWFINSKYMTYKKVDTFLKEQLEAIEKEGVSNPVLALSIRLRAKNGDPYATVFNIEEYVYKNFNYKKDIDNKRMWEYWNTASETLKDKIGDCEDQNILIYILCRLNGISADCLWCTMGETVYGYHFYILLYSPRFNKLVRLDSTINPQIIYTQNKDTFKLDDVFIKIDYIFNEEGAYR